MKQLALQTWTVVLRTATVATSTRCLTYGIMSERHSLANYTYSEVLAVVIAVVAVVLAVYCSSVL
jgi:hypothetical protein